MTTNYNRMTKEQLIKLVKSKEHQRRTGFALYYQERDKYNRKMYDMYEKIKSLEDQLKDMEITEIPTHFKEEMNALYKETKKIVECPICLDVMEIDTIHYTNCFHKCCCECYEKLIKQTEPKCMICRKRIYVKQTNQ